MNSSEPSFVGKNKIFFQHLPSTNLYAMDVLSKTNPIEGSCILTDYQTAGRGQFGRTWYSDEAKNILSSFILYPKAVFAIDQFYLNIVASLAVRDVVASYGVDVKIKWPNDIYVDNKKIAGILVQNTLRDQHINATIIGIGLNVNQSFFPPEIPNPTSLYLLNGRTLERDQVFDRLCAQLEYYYLLLQDRRWKALKNQYYTHMYKFETWSLYRDTQTGVAFEGKIVGITPSGKLEVETFDGTISVFDLKEIIFLHQASSK